MNAKAAKGAKGCAGAVWSDGSFSVDYCTNTGWAKGRFPWWGKCCKENLVGDVAKNFNPACIPK